MNLNILNITFVLQTKVFELGMGAALYEKTAVVYLDCACKFNEIACYIKIV